MDIQLIKQRFGIIGNSPHLNRAIDIARQVAATDLTVLITGESGTGKEFFPKIVHQLSARKHGEYIAVNCGAIPEGTIDSELFGHEKGSFTSADKERKGYFEVANGGTIFLDEVAELPLSTQVRLLRVLEAGEFMRVGSSKVQKTNVRVVAATNVNLIEAIRTGKFREDLYYRLNTVPISIPPLRERKEDIVLFLKKFAADFAEKYRIPATIKLTNEAEKVLIEYHWPGNIRQLKNITEQISIIEKDRDISAETLNRYLPIYVDNRLPVLYKDKISEGEFSEREILYKVLFDMKNDIFELKKFMGEIMQNEGLNKNIPEQKTALMKKLYDDSNIFIPESEKKNTFQTDEIKMNDQDVEHEPIQESEVIEESLSLAVKEEEMIKKALEKYRGKRKNAAKELGISERTLYRKLKEYNLE